MALTSFQSHSSRKNLLFEHIRLGGGGETGFPHTPAPEINRAGWGEEGKPGFPSSPAPEINRAG